MNDFVTPKVDIAYMRDLASNFEDVISLGQGTPSSATPTFIYDAIIKESKLNPDLGKYTPCSGDRELRELISNEVNAHYGIATDYENVYVTSGAIAAIWSALMSVAKKGDEVIVISPFYPKYIDQLNLLGIVPVLVEAKEDNNWQVSVEDIKSAITEKTKAIIINNPVNPTGAFFPTYVIDQIVQLAMMHDFYVITDEAYDFVMYGDFNYKSAIEIEAARDRVILCKSFSKEYAMTGWRIGYMVAPKDIIRNTNKIMPYIVIAASSISQFAAKTILKNSEEAINFMKQQVFRFAKNYQIVTAWLDNHSSYFSYVKPQGTFYVLPKLLMTGHSENFAVELLRQAQTVVIPGDCMGAPGHIRLSFCMEQNQVEIALARMDSFLRNNY